MKTTRRIALVLAAAALTTFVFTAGADEPAKVTHSFLACGGQTRIVGEDGKVVWRYKHGSQDGYVLPNGNILLAVKKCKPFPAGAVVEVTRDGKETVIFKGTQHEIHTVSPIDNGRLLVAEGGQKPRLLEIDRAGKIHVEILLQCQTKNLHMGTRMARKLADGTYLAPHLLDFAVKQYDTTGKVIKTIDTTVEGDPERKIHTWPFTAIRLPDGSTHVNLTHSNRSVRFDAEGKIIWQLTNDDLPGPWLADPCGGQVLPNGNIVIASYGQRNAKLPKLIEVTPDKRVVWTHYDNIGHSAHHFQILTTNGKPVTGKPMK